MMNRRTFSSQVGETWGLRSDARLDRIAAGVLPLRLKKLL
jgi:hypothetical protein